jgi:hypothetical protein
MKASEIKGPSPATCCKNSSLWVTGLNQTQNQLVDPADLLCEALNRYQDRFQTSRQRRWQISFCLYVEAVGVTGRKPGACRLNGTSDVIDEESSRIDEGLSAPNRGQVGLCLGAPMSHGGMQLRVESPQPGESLRIGAVILPGRLSDQLYSSGIRNHHFVPFLTEQAAYPWRMRAGHHNHSTAQVREALSECVLARSKLALINYRAFPVEQAVIAELIRDIDAKCVMVRCRRSHPSPYSLKACSTGVTL